MYWLCFVCDTLNEKHIKNDSKIYHSCQSPYRKYCTFCGVLNPIHGIIISDHEDSIVDGYCRLNSIIDTYPSNTNGEEYFYLTHDKMAILRNSVDYTISSDMIYEHVKLRMYHNSRKSWVKWNQRQRIKRRMNCNKKYKKIIEYKINKIFRSRPLQNIINYL